jgi:hypothetical protein
MLVSESDHLQASMRLIGACTRPATEEFRETRVQSGAKGGKKNEL